MTFTRRYTLFWGEHVLFNVLLDIDFSNGPHVLLFLMNSDMVDRPGDGHKVVKETQLCE